MNGQYFVRKGCKDCNKNYDFYYEKYTPNSTQNFTVELHSREVKVKFEKWLRSLTYIETE